MKVEASTHRTWDQALEMVAFNEHQRPQPGQAMLTLLRANHHLAHIGSLDELLQSILGDTIAALGAQRGSIILMNEAGELQLKAYLRPGKLKPHPEYSKTFTKQCFKDGKSLLCQNVAEDPKASSLASIKSGQMSSIICALLRSPRKSVGVLQLDRGTTKREEPPPPPFNQNDLFLADAIAASVAVGIESAQMVEAQRDQFIQTVNTLARAVEMRDQYTGDHTKRVTDYALMLADELKLNAIAKYQIRIGTPLHDIGKIGIDDAILRKPTPLTDAEFELMKTHTVKGAEILGTIVGVGPMIPIVRHHHEKWDGSGYPDGLKEKQIELNARIVAVADAFDAMTSDRPYRRALSADVAFTEILNHSGCHFDPSCVAAFLRLKEKVERRRMQG